MRRKLFGIFMTMLFVASILTIAAPVKATVSDSLNETIEIYQVVLRDDTNRTISWSHSSIDSTEILSAELTIVADDVDAPPTNVSSGEEDEVWFNGVFLGYLDDMGVYTDGGISPGPGAGPPPQILTSTTFDVTALLDSNDVEVIVEPAWDVEIETSTLEVEFNVFSAGKDFRYTDVEFTPYELLEDPDGIPDSGDEVYQQLPAELGTLLPYEDPYYLVDVVTKKNQHVVSMNPGQLYGVITITPYMALSNITVEDAWGTGPDLLDVNPAKLGGGVEVIVVNSSSGLATVLTDQPGVAAVVDNDGNTAEITIDLVAAMGDPLGPGCILMVYIKFKPIKSQTFSGQAEWHNDATIIIDGYVDDSEATASIMLSEKV